MHSSHLEWCPALPLPGPRPRELLGLNPNHLASLPASLPAPHREELNVVVTKMQLIDMRLQRVEQGGVHRVDHQEKQLAQLARKVESMEERAKVPSG